MRKNFSCSCVFLSAKKHLHKWVCPSIRPSVHYAFSFSAVLTCFIASRGQYLLLFRRSRPHVGPFILLNIFMFANWIQWVAQYGMFTKCLIHFSTSTSCRLRSRVYMFFHQAQNRIWYVQNVVIDHQHLKTLKILQLVAQNNRKWIFSVWIYSEHDRSGNMPITGVSWVDLPLPCIDQTT